MAHVAPDVRIVDGRSKQFDLKEAVADALANLHTDLFNKKGNYFLKGYKIREMTGDIPLKEDKNSPMEYVMNTLTRKKIRSFPQIGELKVKLECHIAIVI